ncbi:MAG: transporter substrate-binding domain-containing protein [Gammaproteobacteria bacterium]|nr:transporter substrate-binding domain-containing protein [Gammaproteobacteria bacterium]
MTRRSRAAAWTLAVLAAPALLAMALAPAALARDAQVSAVPPVDGAELAAEAQDSFARALGLDLANDRWRGDLDGMVQRRYLRVLVPYSKTLYFVDLGGRQRGISHDFMRAFEDDLNQRLGRTELRVHAVFVVVPRDQLIPALLDGRGDVVAANLTITPARARQVAFVEPVARAVHEVVVTGPGAPPLGSLEDLAGHEVFVNPSTSYHEHLRALNDRFRNAGRAPVTLRAAPGHFETEDALEMANAGLAPVVVADAYLARFWAQVFPAIRVREDLVVHEGGEIAFAVRPGSPKLKAALDDFTRRHRQGTTFGNVTLHKYLRQTRWARPATAPQELRRFESLVELFRRYGEKYDIDWLLMAAQGYQESQLDHSRRSAVGAIGVMQIMPATGRELDVGDIRELEPNIHGGVKYMRRMIDRYFADPAVGATDRMLFSFAAYNAGPARVRALRAEARDGGLDPDRWFDHVERVAARRIGRETVQYVSNIYKYYVAYQLVQERVAEELRQAPAAARVR